jgi:predicted alpha-1,2-mannosidase
MKSTIAINVLHKLSRTSFAMIVLMGLCRFGWAQQTSGKVNFAEKVNTTIGTKGKGHGIEEQYLEAGYTFPGATCPFGMVQFTTTFFDENKGFVINQMSGAGCHNMGNLPTLPLAGELSESPKDMMGYKPVFENKQTIAGYYHTVIDGKIDCQLTTTPRTGIATFQYSSDTKTGTIVIGTGINSSEMPDAQASVKSNNTCEGYADGGHFCGIKANYRIFYVIEFQHAAVQTGTWKDNRLDKGSVTASGANSGVFFTFDVSDHQPVVYKVGISYVSIENARENLSKENAGWDFSAVKNKTQAAWNSYLGKIEVKGGSDDRTVQFYSHLYHSFTHPSICSDVNGEYMGADHKTHKSEGFTCYTGFSNWDTYRTQIQLLSLLAPEETKDMVSSLINFAKQSGGGFPRWVLADFETGIMQGDPTSILVANAYAFGVKNFNTKDALAIMRKGAEVPGTKSQLELTRPNLDQYLQKGYMYGSMGASMALEYTSADFAIGQFALQALGDKQTYDSYLKRSGYWRNNFNPETKWLQSRNSDGYWKNQTDDWREASYKNYFWMIPYDLKGLIDTMGGKKAAETRLDEFFAKLNASYAQEWFATGNEPDFQTPWIYNWAGAPYKTQALVRRILKEQYSNRPGGLPGNDDMGAMGAWYVWASVGLYPMIPGYGGFSVNSPSFPDIKIQLPKSTLIITGGSENDMYITSLKINGKDHNQTWIPLDKLIKGGAMNYQLSSEPDKSWGTQSEPPSFRFGNR